MTVYVDKLTTYPLEAIEPVARRNGARWCHLWADSINELHDFASRVGMRRSWFQDRKTFPHYDLVPRRRAMAIKLGAQEKSLREHLLQALATKKEQTDDA